MRARTGLIEGTVLHMDEVWITHVLNTADVVAEFCDERCWKRGEPSVAAAWQLVTTFPAGMPITSCSRCLRELDRRHPYTLLPLQDESYVAATIEAYAAWDYAVLCPRCFPTAMSAEDEVETDYEHMYIEAESRLDCSG